MREGVLYRVDTCLCAPPLWVNLPPLACFKVYVTLYLYRYPPSITHHFTMSAAFSQYRPSANAHTDFLKAEGGSGSSKGKDIRVISLKPRSESGSANIR